MRKDSTLIPTNLDVHMISEKPQQKPNKKLLVQIIGENATPSIRATKNAAEYDIFSNEDLTIPPNEQATVDLGIAVQLPKGTYGRIAPRSGLTVKHNITVMARVIDPDYRVKIKVVLYNYGNKPFTVKIRDKIAQLILEKFESIPTEKVKK